MGIDKRYLFATAALAVIVFVASLVLYPEWQGIWWLLAIAVVVGVVAFAANFRQAFEKKDETPKIINPAKDNQIQDLQPKVNIQEVYAGGDILFSTKGDVTKLGSQVNNLANKMDLPSVPDSQPKASSTTLKVQPVFICYDHADRNFAGKLAGDLKDTGLAVWLDKWEIKVGDSIIQKVSRGISTSAYLIIILSAASVNSIWVQREVNSAIMKQLSEEKRITILPVLLADCEVPVLLRDIQSADFRKSYKLGFAKLLMGIQPKSGS